MNGFNPTKYALEMKILGFGLTACGVAVLVLMGVNAILKKRSSKRG